MDAANANDSSPEELLAYDRTEHTLSDTSLCRLLGRTTINGCESPISTDAGAWSAEYGSDGLLACWRYYRDPHALNAI